MLKSRWHDKVTRYDAQAGYGDECCHNQRGGEEQKLTWPDCGGNTAGGRGRKAIECTVLLEAERLVSEGSDLLGSGKGERGYIVSQYVHPNSTSRQNFFSGTSRCHRDV